MEEDVGPASFEQVVHCRSHDVVDRGGGQHRRGGVDDPLPACHDDLGAEEVSDVPERPETDQQQRGQGEKQVERNLGRQPWETVLQ